MWVSWLKGDASRSHKDVRYRAPLKQCIRNRRNRSSTRLNSASTRLNSTRTESRRYDCSPRSLRLSHLLRIGLASRHVAAQRHIVLSPAKTLGFCARHGSFDYSSKGTSCSEALMPLQLVPSSTSKWVAIAANFQRWDYPSALVRSMGSMS